ncbi:hypothetical protein [Brevibacillus choshinensis]|uniref:hypothetical protein n=1 Tax=Brevibacillus choshinensis TaxID=54911 RepID=UPI000A5C0D89|nr:hypothetical protein [Brevibacillus choshinensis]
MSEFLRQLDLITDISVLETMREELATKAYTAELTWQDRIFINEKIQVIVCRLMNLERN